MNHPHTPPLLLLDGDVFAYVAAAAVQRDLQYEDGHVVRWSDQEEGIGTLNDMVQRVLDRLGTKEYLFFLTDPEYNWRHDILPSYKENRSGLDRPQLLTFLKDYCLTKHSAIRWPGMEADDLMGIYATATGDEPGLEVLRGFSERIIVSKDKDMRGVPGKFFDMNRMSDRQYQVETISEEAADYWHLVQTLAGDKVDNYPGCPGIGVDRAKDVLDSGNALRPEHGFITRGKNKGQRTTKWMPYPCSNPWRIVVSNFEKAGQSEEEALVNARVARICRTEDFNFDNNTVNLWEP